MHFLTWLVFPDTWASTKPRNNPHIDLETAQNNWILTLLSSVELLNSWNSTCFIF